MKTTFLPQARRLGIQAAPVHLKTIALQHTFQGHQSQKVTITPDTPSYTCTPRLEASCSVRYTPTLETRLVLFPTFGPAFLIKVHHTLHGIPQVSPLQCAHVWYHQNSPWTPWHIHACSQTAFPHSRHIPNALYFMAMTCYAIDRGSCDQVANYSNFRVPVLDHQCYSNSPKMHLQ